MKLCLTCGMNFESNAWICPRCHGAPQTIDGFMSFSPTLAQVNDGFKNSYFAKLFNIESGNFWFRARNRLIIYALQYYFPEMKTFLEIGCGTGFVLDGIKKAFPHLLLCGADIYSEGLAYARKRLRGNQLFQMDARKIPFENEFDLMGAFDILEHIQEDELVLTQMHKALHHRGGIIISVPQHRFLWSNTDERDCHVRRYTMKELTSKVETAGFEVIDVISFTSLLLPLMLLDRFKKRVLIKEDSIIEELCFGMVTNAILEKIMDIEFLFVRLGVRLKFGGSLFLIGRKLNK